METDEGYERLDFSEEQWEVPKSACIGWWTCQAPESTKGRVYWAPNDVLLAYFESLLAKPGLAKICFVMGILLVRRKVLRMLPNEIEQNQSLMVLEAIDKSQTYRVLIEEPSPTEVKQIQQELAEQLFTDCPPEK